MESAARVAMMAILKVFNRLTWIDYPSSFYLRITIILTQEQQTGEESKSENP
jgi:hypothetical protein